VTPGAVLFLLLLVRPSLAQEGIAEQPVSQAGTVNVAPGVVDATLRAAPAGSATTAVSPSEPATGTSAGTAILPEGSGSAVPAPQSATLAGAGAVGDQEGPPAPEGVVAVGTDRAINVFWFSSPAENILGYNVYRSTEEGVFGTVPVNRSLVTGTEFMDNEENSIMPPENGVTYHYTVRAVDDSGRLSGPSEEARGRPESAPVISEVPKVGWEGFGESQLSVSGRKVVSMGFTVRTPKTSPGSSQLSGPMSQRPNLEQQLQVKLNGTVGKKIAVNVNYDDTAPDQTQQQISVVWNGEPQETIERAEFGDVRLQLSDTEFSGYDKTLFGLRLQARPVEKLRLIGVATQTQGINYSEQFVGSNSTQEVEIPDTAYVSNKYFHVSSTRMIDAHLGIRPGTEQVWLDDGSAYNNIPGVTRKIVKADGTTYNFDLMYSGVDYSIDYTSGVLIFNRSIANNASIAVAFEYGDGTEVYFQGGKGTAIGDADAATLVSNWDITKTNWAETDATHHLIYNGAYDGPGDAHMITNRYQLGFRNIVPPDFDPDFSIKVYDTTGNEVTRIVKVALDSSFYDFGILELRNDPDNTDRSLLGPTPASDLPSDIRYNKCPPVSEQPFAYGTDNRFLERGNSAYAYGMSTTRVPRYKIKLKFLTRILSYRLRNINVVRGSERITMDGRVLTRDVDYFIDYEFGQVTFLRQEQIRYDSRIRIDYEYLPFGGQFQSFLWGARGQYELSDKTSVGATFLSNNSQNPQEAPSPTGAPKSTQILGTDAHTFLSRRDLSNVVQVLPGFERSVVPLEMEIRGEVARSDINPNTFKQGGVDENGVAMIDSMEGVDDVVEAGVESSSWFPSAPPEGELDSGRTRELSWHTGQGGHSTDVTRSLARTLDLQYRGLDLNKWDGLRYVLSTIPINMTNYQYMEMWVYGDGSGNRLSIDLGALSENSNKRVGSTVYTEDMNGDFTLNAGEDNGIFHDGSAYWGSGGATFWNGWGGPGTGILNNEDMNGNDALDNTNNYFEYSFNVDWTGWRYIKIPLGFDARSWRDLRTFDPAAPIAVRTGLGPLTVRRDRKGSADPSVIRNMRVWLKGEGRTQTPTDASGNPVYIRIETLAVTGNRWLLSTSPGASLFTDSSRFNVSAINQEISASYPPLLKFYTVREQGAEKLEQALQIDYNLYDDHVGNYYATRLFYSPMNMLDYGQIRFEIYKANTVNNGNGEILFLRLGGDEKEYYQYNIPLDSVGPGWQTISIDLKDERNRYRVGNPALSAIKQFCIGVSRYDPPVINATETLWINNLRVVNPIHKTGLARKINVRLSTPMGATFLVDPNEEILPANAGVIVDTTYRELDNDFRLIDQPMFLQNDQHRAGLTSVVQVRQIPNLPITANITRDESYTEKMHRDDPTYYSWPDRSATNYVVNVSSQHIGFLPMDFSANRNEERLRYLTEKAGDDFMKVNWSASPRIRIVTQASEISALGRYTKDKIDYEEMPLQRASVDRINETVDEQYDARTTFRPLAYAGSFVPFVGGISTSPRAGYRRARSRGAIGSVQVVNISNPTMLASGNKFQPITEEMSAAVDNRLEAMKGLRPSANYVARVRRDWTLLNLSTNSTLTSGLEFNPGEWLGFFRDQSFNFNYTIETNAQYYDLTRNVTYTATGQTRRVVVDPVTRRVDPVDRWWVTRKDDTLANSSAFADAYTAGGRLVFWQSIAFTPNWSFREDTRLAQMLRSRTTATTSSTAVSLMRGEYVTKVFNYTPLFWMGFSGFDANYSFQKSTTFDIKDLPTSITERNQAQGTLPFSPFNIRGMNGNVTVASEAGVTRTLPLTKTYQQSIRPGLALGYSRSAGLEFPLIWWRIKLANLFTIRETLQMNYVKNVAIGMNTGNRKARETQAITEFEYEMLRGVQLKIRFQYDQVKDKTTPLNSFKAYSMFGTFSFNF
jgi:hypothetical protein